MTEKLYDRCGHIKIFDGKVRELREDGSGVWIRLDRTAFYPEGGGQPSDTGVMHWTEYGTCGFSEEHQLQVLDVQEIGEEIWHRIEPEREDGEPQDGQPSWWRGFLEMKQEQIIYGEINWSRRMDLMEQHSGEHIVSGLIHQRFGYDNVGFHLSVDTMTLDMNGELTWEELMEIEAAANEVVRANRPVEISHPGREELTQLSYRSKKELSGDVRIVNIPGADSCACCGTHVAYTGEIGLIKITAMQKWKSGVRIWMCCGGRAERYCWMLQEQNRRISVGLSAKPEETAAAVDRVCGELNQMKQELTGWKYRYYEQVVKACEGQPGVVRFEDGLTMEDLRHLTDRLMDTCPGECFVFSGNDSEGYRYAVGKRGGDVRGLVKEMNGALSGRGGGKNEMAQGSLQATRAQIEAWINGRI